MTTKTMAHLRAILKDVPVAGQRYSLLEEIGRGGMGIVYRAEDAELDREVAIKVLSAGSAAALERMQREARILARLEHPGIVPIHDSGTLPDRRPFYVMKLVRGERLDAYRQGAASMADRLRLFQRLCEPVAFAHARGVVHRDLKPENIMVGEFGEVLVLDWGIAKVQDEAEAPEVMGTRAYMAPEQAGGDLASVDERADVFALGKILRFLLAQDRLPKPLEAICAKASAVNRDDRYAGARDVGRDVERFLDRMPVSACPESLLDRARRIGAKYQWLIALIAAYIVMRAILIFWMSR